MPLLLFKAFSGFQLTWGKVKILTNSRSNAMPSPDAFPGHVVSWAGNTFVSYFFA